MSESRKAKRLMLPIYLSEEEVAAEILALKTAVEELQKFELYPESIKVLEGMLLTRRTFLMEGMFKKVEKPTFEHVVPPQDPVGMHQVDDCPCVPFTLNEKVFHQYLTGPVSDSSSLPQTATLSIRNITKRESEGWGWVFENESGKFFLPFTGEFKETGKPARIRWKHVFPSQEDSVIDHSNDVPVATEKDGRLYVGSCACKPFVTRGMVFHRWKSAVPRVYNEKAPLAETLSVEGLHRVLNTWDRGRDNEMGWAWIIESADAGNPERKGPLRYVVPFQGEFLEAHRGE